MTLAWKLFWQYLDEMINFELIVYFRIYVDLEKIGMGLFMQHHAQVHVTITSRLSIVNTQWQCLRWISIKLNL